MKNLLSDYIKKRLYIIGRNRAKIYLTGNLGPVIEEEKKLICYVKKNKIKKGKSDCIIPCHGIEKTNKELAEEYKLNKPIEYIIENLEFEKLVFIFGYNNCSVNIKNCTFNNGLLLNVKGKCTLDDTFIKSFEILQLYAKEMAIKNINISNSMSFACVSLCINIETDNKLDIFNSNIGRENQKTAVFLSSFNGINLAHTKIAGNKIECKSKSIISDIHSSLTASDNVKITTDDINQVNIISPNIIYNNKDFSSINNTLEKVSNPLIIKRLELINLLKKLKNKCEKINIEKLEEYEIALNNESISKVLRKSNRKYN